jgi:hypothetical protein
MVLRILGIVLVAVIALWLIGAIFKVLGTVLVIGVIALLGAGVYTAVRNRSRRELR